MEVILVPLSIIGAITVAIIVIGLLVNLAHFIRQTIVDYKIYRTNILVYKYCTKLDECKSFIIKISKDESLNENIRNNCIEFINDINKR